MALSRLALSRNVSRKRPFLGVAASAAPPESSASPAFPESPLLFSVRPLNYPHLRSSSPKIPEEKSEFYFQHLFDRYSQDLFEKYSDHLFERYSQELFRRYSKELFQKYTEGLFEEFETDSSWDVSSPDDLADPDDYSPVSRRPILENIKSILQALKNLKADQVEKFEEVTSMTRRELRHLHPKLKNQEAINNSVHLSPESLTAIENLAQISRGASFRHNSILNKTWKQARLNILNKAKWKCVREEDEDKRDKLSEHGIALYEEVRQIWPDKLLAEMRKINLTFDFSSSDFDSLEDFNFYLQLCERRILNKEGYERACIHHVEYKDKAPDRAISTRNLLLVSDHPRKKTLENEIGSHAAHHSLMAIGEPDIMKTQSKTVLDAFKKPFMIRIQRKSLKMTKLVYKNESFRSEKRKR